MLSLELKLLSGVTPESRLGQQWESLVKATPASGIMQSLYWAEVKRRQGLHLVHFGIFDHGDLTGGALLYLPARLNGTGLMVAPEGPVLPWDDTPRATEMLRLIADGAAAYAADHGIMSMRIEPRIEPPPATMLREFGRAPADLVPRETLYVDISGSSESLLSRMKPKGRYNIKLADRNAVSIVESASADAIQPFYKAVAEASDRDGFALERQSFFEHLGAVLCDAGHARFFLAYHEGDLLGSLLLTTYGERATYLYGGTTDVKRSLMGGYALQWAAMQHARRAGCRIYDFYGYAPHRSSEHEYSRFSQFKSQFGGEAIRFIGAHDYFFLDNVADAFIKATQEVAAKTSVVKSLTGCTGALHAPA